MDGACGIYVREDNCMQSFGGETWKKKTTWKSHSGRMILKWMLSIIGGHGLDCRDEAGCCEHVHEYSCFVKCWEFLDQLLKKDNKVWREAVRLWAGWSKNCGVIPGDSKRIFLLQIVPHDPGAHPSAYSIDTDALRQECNSQDMNLTAHFHPVLKLQMHRAIPPLPNTPSWCGDQLSTGVTFTLCCLVLFGICDAAWQFL